MVKRAAVGFLVSACLLAAGAMPGRASKKKQKGNDPAVTALIAKALAASDIEAEKSPAFRLEARLRVELGQGRSEDGKLMWIWTPVGWWHNEVDLPEYQSVEISAGSQVWLSSTADYLPFPVYLAEQALNISQWLRRAKQQMLGSPQASPAEGETCIAAKDDSEPSRYCFDTLSGNLTRVADGQWNVTIRYADYAPFGAESFPRRIEILQNDVNQFIDIRVVQLAQEKKPDLRLFLPVSGATLLPTAAACSEIVPAKVEKLVRPEYPLEAENAGITGVVKLYADIGPDGIPRGLWPVNNSAPILAQAAIAAVREWRYQPRTCKSDGTKLEEIQPITIVFNTR